MRPVWLGGAESAVRQRRQTGVTEWVSLAAAEGSDRSSPPSLAATAAAAAASLASHHVWHV